MQARSRSFPLLWRSCGEFLQRHADELQVSGVRTLIQGDLKGLFHQRCEPMKRMKVKNAILEEEGFAVVCRS